MRSIRPRCSSGASPCVVLLPAGHARGGDGRALFQLRKQVGGVELAGQERGTDIHPSVFIHLSR